MELIASATERTTAATDLILAIVALAGAVRLGRAAPPSLALRIWQAALISAGTGAALGAVAHGLVLAEQTRTLLWQPLFFLLGVTVSLFVLGAVAARWGDGPARRLLLPMGGVALLFYLATRLFAGQFLVFVAFQAVALLFAIVVYLRLALRRGGGGEALVAAALGLTLAAGAVQAQDSLHLRLIWEFDHNGLYHLVQLIGLGLLIRGLVLSLRPPAPSG